jgi:hypothetical protein
MKRIGPSFETGVDNIIAVIMIGMFYLAGFMFAGWVGIGLGGIIRNLFFS